MSYLWLHLENNMMILVAKNSYNACFGGQTQKLRDGLKQLDTYLLQ